MTLSKQKLAEMRAKLLCLIPREGSFAPSCHEFHTCDCTVLELLEAVEKLRDALGEAHFSLNEIRNHRGVPLELLPFVNVFMKRIESALLEVFGPSEGGA